LIFSLSNEMPFDWNNYLVLAEDLAQHADEASKRTSVSRAYYSAFHDAMARAERNCGPKQGGNSHDWCWNRYIYCCGNVCNQLGIDGNRLKAKRHQADYNGGTIDRLDEFVQRAIEDARSIKGRIAALDPQHPHP
jgi:uncharacterized protein (UPF0332 family)